MVSEHVWLLETSETNATNGVEQLSVSSVTTFGFGAGTKPIHSTVIGAGLLAEGAIKSWIIIFWDTFTKLPQASVTL